MVTRLVRVKRPQLSRRQTMPKELWQFARSTRPPLKKPRVHLTRGTGESSSVNDPVESSIPEHHDLYTDCYWSREVSNDEILFVNKSTNTIVWSRLTEKERACLMTPRIRLF